MTRNTEFAHLFCTKGCWNCAATMRWSWLCASWYEVMTCMVVWHESCEAIATLEGSCTIFAAYRKLSKNFLSHWTSIIARYPPASGKFLRSSLGLHLYLEAMEPSVMVEKKYEKMKVSSFDWWKMIAKKWCKTMENASIVSGILDTNGCRPT